MVLQFEYPKFKGAHYCSWSIDGYPRQENKLIIDRLGRIIPIVEQTGIAIAIVLALIAVVVVFNTIRLITYTARDEISVMKLADRCR